MLFKDALASEIERRELTFKDVQTLCEISSHDIMTILAGKRVKDDILIKVCEGLHIDIDDITLDELNMSVKEASEMTGKSQDFVRIAIEQGRLPGSCVTSENGTRSFHIPRKAMEKYMGMSEDFTLGLLVDVIIAAIEEKKEKTPEAYQSI